jgi:hypothetical protein
MRLACSPRQMGSELACLIGHLRRKLHVNIKKTTATWPSRATTYKRGGRGVHYRDGVAITRERSLPVTPRLTNGAPRRRPFRHAQHSVAPIRLLHDSHFLDAEASHLATETLYFASVGMLMKRDRSARVRSAYRPAMLRPQVGRAPSSTAMLTCGKGRRLRNAKSTFGQDHSAVAEKMSNLGSIT